MAAARASTVGRLEKHSERMKSLLNSGNGSFDVTFVVGSTAEKVNAHKFILKAHSRVFAEMFPNCKDERMMEVTVDIPGATGAEFRLFLEFLYTGVFSGNVHAPQMLKYAVHYEIPDLQECCSVQGESITIDSVVNIYEVACKHVEVGRPLQIKALDFILKNGNSILKSDNFLNLTRHNLFTVLASDHLRAPNETQVFEATLRWGKEQCRRNDLPINGTNLRNAMNDLIPLIRFPVMNKSDFSFLVAPAEILTTEEVISIFRYFTLDESKRATMQPPPFSTVERVWFKVPPEFGLEEYICQRLVPVGNSEETIQYYDVNGARQDKIISIHPAFSNKTHISYELFLHTPHFIRFRVSSSVWISSIGINIGEIGVQQWVFGSAIPNTVTFRVDLLETATKQVINSVEEEFAVIDLNGPTKLIRFLHPVKIQANDSYTIRFKIAKGSYKPLWYLTQQGTSGAQVQVIAGVKTLTFEFEEEVPRTYPCVTGLKQGFIPTIGFKLDAATN